MLGIRKRKDDRILGIWNDGKSPTTKKKIWVRLIPHHINFIAFCPNNCGKQLDNFTEHNHCSLRYWIGSPIVILKWIIRHLKKVNSRQKLLSITIFKLITCLNTSQNTCDRAIKSPKTEKRPSFVAVWISFGDDSLRKIHSLIIN